MELKDFINEGKKELGLESLNESEVINEKNNSLSDFHNALKDAGAKNLTDPKYDSDLESEAFRFDTKSGEIVEVFFSKGNKKVQVSTDSGIEELTPKETVALINESEVINEEAYDWLKDNGLNPRKRYKLGKLERELGRELSDNEIQWLRSEGVLEGDYNFDVENAFGLNEAELSPLQIEYREYFKEVLASFDVESPAKLSFDKTKEFFNKIKEGWVKGKGRKGGKSEE